jgi:sugar porter (SP) family MFS transporter
VVFFVGTLGGVFAPNIEIMLPARIILGFAVGAASVTVPVYLAELAPTERRGALSGRNELAIVIGQMLAFIINALIFNIWGEHDGVWRIMLAVAAIPAVALFVGMLRMPESPRWLISQGRHDDALAVLVQVRSEDRARAEMAEVEHLAQEEAEAKLGGWADLKVAWIRRIVLIGCGLAAAQQLTGINSVMYYGTQLLTEAGFSASAAIIANIANGVLAVAGSAICLFFVVDRVSRRGLILWGFVATTTCHGLIMVAASVMPEGTARAVVILVLCVTFVFSMQLTLNVPVWVCLSEMFPLRLRGFAMGLSVTVLWLVNAGLTFSFPVIVEAAGLQGIFGLFFVVGVLIIGFVWKFLPNTSGRSLEQLEEDFAGGKFN